MENLDSFYCQMCDIVNLTVKGEFIRVGRKIICKECFESVVDKYYEKLIDNILVEKGEI